VSASSERFIQKARGLAADEVFLDLVDAAASSAQAQAQAQARAHAVAALTGDWGAVWSRSGSMTRPPGDEMIDEASRKMARAIVARGSAGGFASGEPGQIGE
jgi:citrate lyase beta subunit